MLISDCFNERPHKVRFVSRRMTDENIVEHKIILSAALTGLGYFVDDLPRAALADSLCPGLLSFGLSALRNQYNHFPIFPPASSVTPWRR
jgi:hypothetical protein